MKPQWEIPEELWILDEEAIKLSMSLAATLQKDLETTTVALKGQIQTMLSVLIGLCVISTVFTFAHLGDVVTVRAPGAVCSWWCFVLSVYLLLYGYTGDYIPTGSAPSELLEEAYVKSDEKDRGRHLQIVTLYGAEFQVEHNQGENDRRGRVYRTALYGAILLPVALPLTYGVAWVLTRGSL